VLGNISDEDVRHTIERLPALCADQARVIWTRTRRPPDLTPQVRKWFESNGFRELRFYPVDESLASVGVCQLARPVSPTLGDDRLFTFLS
jgi:hypothetical protein